MQRRRTLVAASLLTSCLVGFTAGCVLRDPFAVEPPESCEVDAQKDWVVDVMREYYLWTDELPVDEDIDKELYETPEELVASLRQGVDRWTRVRDKSTSDALFMEGKFIGLGYKTLRGPDDEVRLSFINDNSPASNAGLLRGDRLVSINGRTIEDLDENGGWSGIYGENDPGVDVDIEVEHLDSGEIEALTLTKAWIDIVSIPVYGRYTTPSGGQVGYYLMDKFVETTKAELEGVYQSFKDDGLSTLIIDMRYNGGGLISVAELQINLSVGADHDNEVAYRYEYNVNYADENKETKISKQNDSIGSDNIIVLTTKRTLSASELVINALKPYANVTLIGVTTGGKPVGSRSFQFCEKLLFPITFRLTNAAGTTDYFEGLTPDCYAEDDLFHQLGDEEEGMLAAAIAYLEDGTCQSEPEAPLPGPGARPQRIDASPDTDAGLDFMIEDLDFMALEER